MTTHDPEDADCGAPDEYLRLERSIVGLPAVRGWGWDPEEPDVFNVQMRIFSSARDRERVIQALAPTRVHFVRRIRY